MSRLSELIAELCPDGVEYKTLGEVLDYEQPGNYIVKSTNYDDSYKTPVLTAGQAFILGYTNETEGIYAASDECPVVIFDDFTTSYHWVVFAFKVKSSAIKILTAKDERAALFKYAFYAMQQITYTPSEHSRQWISVYSRFRIPVPPIEVQREIVRILDSLQELDDALSAEIEAREKQFETCLSKLMTKAAEGSTVVKLGSRMKVVRGASPRPIKSYLTTSDDGVHWIKIGDVGVGGKYVTDTAEYVTPIGATKSRFLKRGSLILSNSMSFGRPYILDIDGCIHDGWLAMSEYESSYDRDFL